MRQEIICKVKELPGHDSLDTKQNYIFSTQEDLRGNHLYREQQQISTAKPEGLPEAYDVPKPIINLVLQSLNVR